MSSVTIDAEAIPSELRERDQWLLWDASADSPRRPHWRGDFGVSWTDPDDWHSFTDAVNAADERGSWGIGYVFANTNDEYARGLYGALDLDGCMTDDGPKDWLPSLHSFIQADAYMELSPSGEGIHIPLAGFEPPEWWRDIHLSDDEHEGVEAYGKKFFTFTGHKLRDAGDGVADTGDWVDDWLIEAHKAITGDDPTQQQPAEFDDARDGGRANRDEYLDRDDIADALDHIDPDVTYPTWRDIGFALADFFPTGTAKSLYTEWSRRGQKWDRDADRQAERIIEDASSGGGRTIGTVIHHARDGGWEMPTPSDGSGDRTTAVSEAQQAAETDGGGTTATAASGGDADMSLSLRERVQSNVLTPLDPPDDYDGDEIDLNVAVNRFVELLKDEYAFVRPRSDVRGWRDTLYVYQPDEGVYEPHGESFIEMEAERLLGPVATNQRCKEIVQKVERQSLVRPGELTADPHRLVVDNGIVDLHTGDLDDHTPGEYHRTRLDWAYDQDAHCARIDEFFHEVVDDSDVRTLYQLVAHCIYKEYLEEKAAMLLGDGQNGKSVYLSVLSEFLGEYNVSRRSLQDFGENDFAANNLQGKLANLHPDMASETVSELGVFKQLTGRDTVVADVKYERPIQFENHATLIFAANRMPKMTEDTHALWRRWIYVNFPYTFSANRDDAKDPVPKRKLMDELTEPEQMRGLLARAVDELARWHEDGTLFTDVASPEQVREKMKRASEPVYDFAMTCLDIADDDTWVRKERVRECYREFAREEGLPTIADNAFGERLHAIRDLPVEGSQRRAEDGNDRIQVYKGITFSSRGRQILGMDEDDVNETVTAGRKLWEKAVEATRELQTDTRSPSGAMITGKLHGELTPKEAKRAVEKAKEKGEIYDDGSGYRVD